MDCGLWTMDCGLYPVNRMPKDPYKILKEDKNLTPFQKRVYKAVLDIPRGKVRSYKWVARRIGKPHACRAVGQALKRNPYTIVIPCHRVVNSDRSIGGYSGGIRMKEKLLREESSC